MIYIPVWNHSTDKICDFQCQVTIFIPATTSTSCEHPHLLKLTGLNTVSSFFVCFGLNSRVRIETVPPFLGSCLVLNGSAQNDALCFELSSRTFLVSYFRIFVWYFFANKSMIIWSTQNAQVYFSYRNFSKMSLSFSEILEHHIQKNTISKNTATH